MASLLESYVRQAIGQGFAGRLLPGVIRRETHTTVQSSGEPNLGTPTLGVTQGIVDTFSAFYTAQNGIPLTDVKIVLIGALTSFQPIKGDKISFTAGERANLWYQVRQVLAIDPADASYTLQGFKIPTPS